MAYEWTEMAFFEVQAGNTAMAIFAVRRVDGLPGAGRAIRKLVAALGGDPGGAHVPAQRDRRRLGDAPCSCPSRYPGGGTCPADINIFTQIGFVVLVGLASKNAILIVEFAKHQREEGVSGCEADPGGLQAPPAADRDDLASAFILGVVPAVDRPRRRRRDAADPGHGRLQRHVGRDHVRHLPHARLLQRDRLAGRIARCSTPRLAASGSPFSRLGFSPWGSVLDAAPVLLAEFVARARVAAASGSAEPTATTPINRIEDAPCFHASSSIDRSSLRCCRSSSRWPAASPSGCCPSPSIRRSRRPRSRSRPPIPAPTPRWWPTPWPPRSSSRSTAWKACSTCRRSAPTTAPTRSRSPSSWAST